MKRFDSLHPLLFFFPQIQQSDKKDFSESFSSRYICATRPQSLTFFLLPSNNNNIEAKATSGLLIDKKALRSQYFGWQSNRHIFFFGVVMKKKRNFTTACNLIVQSFLEGNNSFLQKCGNFFGKRLTGWLSKKKKNSQI